MSETKDKIVELADHLLRVKGFNGFSYKDISDPLSLKNAAIHYHFPAKADLGVEVIDHELTKFAGQTKRWQSLPEDEQLEKLIGVFRKHCQDKNICLMGSLASDFETLSPEMRVKVQELGKRILAWLTGCLEQGRHNKRLHFKGEASDRALMIMTNLQSSLLMSRVLGPQVFNSISTQLMKDLKK